MNPAATPNIPHDKIVMRRLERESEGREKRREESNAVACGVEFAEAECCAVVVYMRGDCIVY